MSKDRICVSCRNEISLIGEPQCPLCGVPFASDEVPSHVCGECLRGKRPFSTARSIVIYKGEIRRAIQMLKYKGKTSMARPFGEMMAKSITGKNKQGSPETDTHGYDYNVIVPVPLHKTRLKERGFNQSLLLARVIGRTLGVPIDYLHLKRIRETVPQINLTGKKRFHNVKNAFQVQGSNFFKDKRVLLIDDVYTTGATITECGKVIKKSGSQRIDVLTLARAVNL